MSLHVRKEISIQAATMRTSNTHQGNRPPTGQSRASLVTEDTRSARRRTVLNSSTLEPIDDDQPSHPAEPLETIPTIPHDSLETTSPILENQPLQPLPKDRAAAAKGVMNFSPPRGPMGCKLIIFLKHTSMLAAKAITFHNAQAKQSQLPIFWVEFDDKLEVAEPHLRRFEKEGKVIEREVLVCLVPARDKKRVPVRLFVERGKSGCDTFKMGWFEYDDSGEMRCRDES